MITGGLADTFSKLFLNKILLSKVPLSKVPLSKVFFSEVLFSEVLLTSCDGDTRSIELVYLGDVVKARKEVL